MSKTEVPVCDNISVDDKSIIRNDVERNNKIGSKYQYQRGRGGEEYQSILFSTIEEGSGKSQPQQQHNTFATTSTAALLLSLVDPKRCLWIVTTIACVLCFLRSNISKMYGK